MAKTSSHGEIFNEKALVNLSEISCIRIKAFFILQYQFPNIESLTMSCKIEYMYCACVLDTWTTIYSSIK